MKYMDDYNWKNIGQRIALERKKKENSSGKPWTQDDLIEELGKEGCKLSRNTLSALEAGKKVRISLDLILCLCDIFQCDIGYLLCEYDDCKTRDNQFIHDQTGLSEEAIKSLSFLAILQLDDECSFINGFLTSPNFATALQDISLYASLCKKNSIRGHFLNQIKHDIGIDEYHELHAVIDEKIKKGTGINIDISALDASLLYKLSAQENILEAFRDTMKGMVQDGSNH